MKVFDVENFYFFDFLDGSLEVECCEFFWCVDEFFEVEVDFVFVLLLFEVMCDYCVIFVVLYDVF